MKEACSTRVPEDSYPPPSSPGSRKLPAVFPGAFLPILPVLPILPILSRSCFFRRHQKGFFFPFFLPVAPLPGARGEARPAQSAARPCPALSTSGKRGNLGEVMGCRDGGKGQTCGGLLAGKAPHRRCLPARRSGGGRGSVPSRCCRCLGTPGAATALCAPRWEEAARGSGGAPRLKNRGERKEERVSIPTLYLQCIEGLNTV